jgi:hypothetical protein
VSALTPVLSHAADTQSNLEPAVVVGAVESHLRTAPEAWDPFRITR